MWVINYLMVGVVISLIILILDFKHAEENVFKGAFWIILIWPIPLLIIFITVLASLLGYFAQLIRRRHNDDVR